MASTNGFADTIIEQSRAKCANGSATDNDRLIVVMDALTNRGIAATEAARDSLSNRSEFKVKLFGREWSATEMVFGFGVMFAAETGFTIATIAG